MPSAVPVKLNVVCWVEPPKLNAGFVADVDEPKLKPPLVFCVAGAAPKLKAASGFLTSVLFVVVLLVVAPKPPNVVVPDAAVLPNVGVALVDEAAPPNGDDPNAGAGVAALPLELAPNILVAAGAELEPKRFVLEFVVPDAAVPEANDGAGTPKIEEVCC